MEQTKPQTAAAAETEESTVSITELIRVIKSRWIWYVISVAVCLAIATIYYMRAVPMYTRSIQVLLKDESTQSVGPNLQDLGINTTDPDILNEMFVMTSPEVMTQVVEKLGLNDVYTVPEGLHRRELYQTSPIAVERVRAEGEADKGFSAQVHIDSEKEFTITSIKQNKEKFGDDISGRFGDTINTPIGRITVYATNAMNEDYVDEKVTFSHTSVAGAAESMSSAITAKYDDDLGYVITLSLSSSSIQKADDVLKAVVESYNDRWIADRNKIAIATSNFIDERLKTIESELGSVESNISEYQSRNQLLDMSAVAQMYMQQSQENRKAINELAQNIATAQYIKSELATNDITRLLPTIGNVGDTNLSTQITEYNKLVSERNLRLKNMPEESPILQKKTETIREMHKAIMESADAALNILKANYKALNLIDNDTRSQIASAPGQATYLRSEERNQKVKETLFLYLLERREENQLSQAFNAYNTRMVTPPTGDSTPSSPNKRNIFAMAFLLGLVIPTGIIYLMEMTNTKVRSREDLAGCTIPFVGEIPRVQALEQRSRWFPWQHVQDITDSNKRPRELLIKPHSGSVVNEAFRMVRTNIDFIAGYDRDNNATSAQHRGKVMMVMSLNVSSGKTFVSLNTAGIFAIKDKKVCIVDLDLRKGTLSKTVGSPVRGITDYLIGNATLDEVIYPHVKGLENLDMLPEGTVPPNPTELLYVDRMAKLVEELRERYDYIIFDCAPVEVVADAKVLNNYVDMSLLVIRAGVFERKQLPYIQEFYDTKRYKNMMLLLNATEDLHGVYGRYGYGYGYSYDTTGKRSKHKRQS